MSFDAYTVAIKLKAVDQFSGVMGLLSKQAAKTGLQMDELQAKISKIGKSFGAGAMAAGAGVGMLASLKGPLEMAMDFQRESAKLHQMGLGDAQIADAQKFVTATQIIGTSIQERMRLFTEAQGAFRESGMSGDKALEAAKTMMPALAAYQVATKTLNGEKRTAAESQMLSLNRLVEQMGGLNDPTRAKAIVDAAFRSVQASGKMISPDQLRQFRAYGGAATANLSDEAIFAGLEPIMGELKGSTTGMGLRTASNRMHGVVMPPHQMLNEVLRLGIWDKHAMEFNSMGGIKRMKGDPLTASLRHLMDTNPPEFAKMMMGIYKSHGITTTEAMSRENTLLFGSNGAKVYDLMMRQMPVIGRSVDAYRLSRGIDQTNKDNADSPMMQIERFHSALNDLSLAIGQTVLPVFTPFIAKFADLFNWLAKHQTLAAGLTVAFTGLAGAMAFGGMVTMMASAVKGMTLAASLFTPTAMKAAASMGTMSVAMRGIGGVALAGAAGYAFGTLLNEWISSAIQSATGGKSQSLGDWVFDSTHETAAEHDKKWQEQFNREHPGHPEHPEHNVRRGAGTVVVHVPVHIDGKKVAHIVTPHIARNMSTGMSGGGFDNGLSLAMPGVG